MEMQRKCKERYRNCNVKRQTNIEIQRKLKEFVFVIVTESTATINGNAEKVEGMPSELQRTALKQLWKCKESAMKNIGIATATLEVKRIGKTSVRTTAKLQ